MTESKSEPDLSSSQPGNFSTPVETYDRFDSNLSSLISLCKKILEIKDHQKLNLTQVGNPLLKCLCLYEHCYQRNKPEERGDFHVVLFREIFDRYRNQIVNDGHKKDNWLLTGDITIQFGSNYGQKNQIKIFLSVIYDVACQLRDDAKKRLENATDNDYQEAVELNYPDAFLLYLYRIFQAWSHQKADEVALNAITSNLEVELGLDSEKSGGGGLSEGLGGIVSLATNMFKGMGLQPPTGSEAPSEQQIGSALGAVFNNEGTQKALSGMFQGLGECNGIEDLIGKLVGGIGSSDITKAIGESLSGAANAAASASSSSSTSSSSPALLAPTSPTSASGSRIEEVPVNTGEVPVIEN